MDDQKSLMPHLATGKDEKKGKDDNRPPPQKKDPQKDGHKKTRRSTQKNTRATEKNIWKKNKKYPLFRRLNKT